MKKANRVDESNFLLMDDAIFLSMKIPAGIILKLRMVINHVIEVKEIEEMLDGGVILADATGNVPEGSSIFEENTDNFEMEVTDGPIENENNVETSAAVVGCNEKPKDKFCKCGDQAKKQIMDMNITENSIEDWILDWDKKTVHKRHKIMIYLDSNEALPEQTEHCLVECLVQKMIDLTRATLDEKEKNKAYYPKHCLKLHIAKCLVKKYPKLCGPPKKYLGVKNYQYEGHEKWYDGSVGPIETKCKTHRSTLPPEKKIPRKKRSSEMWITEDMTDLEVYENKIDYLRNLPPNDNNRELIKKIMRETRELRKNEVFNKLDEWDLNVLLGENIHLLSYNGAIISEEFKYLFPQCKNFETVYSKSYIPRVKKYIFENYNYLLEYVKDIQDEGLQSLALLAGILCPEFEEKKVPALPEVPSPSPTPAKQKKRQTKVLRKPKFEKLSIPVLPHSKLLKFIKKTDDKEALLEKKSREKNKWMPTLLCEQSSDDERSGPYYVRLQIKRDSKPYYTTVSLGNNFLHAFSRYVEIYLLFQLELPKQLNEFFNFILGCVIQYQKPNKTVEEVNKKLMKIDVDESDDPDSQEVIINQEEDANTVTSLPENSEIIAQEISHTE